jgi:hypothetical protein
MLASSINSKFSFPPFNCFAQRKNKSTFLSCWNWQCFHLLHR